MPSFIDHNLFWDLIQSQIPRLISQIDRNPLSKTYGSFDRKYWHQRFTEFSSASLQQGVETLAFIYSYKKTDNPYYKNQDILTWIEAAISYTAAIQNKDGSFDEWYRGEQGWAGPTSYILNSIYSAQKYLGADLSIESKKLIETVFENSIDFLGQFEEQHVLSNHQAIALLSLKQAEHLVSCERAKKHFNHLLRRFLKYFDNDEGWSLEYDGADPGYQTATLSFLARLDDIEPIPEIRNTIAKQLEFVSHFVFPDGSFCEGLGSRSTANVFFYGLSYWSQYHEMASHILNHLQMGLKNRKVLAPQDQEDHYLIYRLPEFALLTQSLHPKSLSHKKELPFRQADFIKHFKKAGHIVIKKQDLYLVIDAKFGGRYKAYSLKSQQLKYSGGDCFIKSGKQTLTTGAGNTQVSLNNNSIELTTTPSPWKNHLFSTKSIIAFKVLFSLTRHSSKISQVCKSFIRKHLMFAKKIKAKTVKTQFKILDDQVHIHRDFSNYDNIWLSNNQPSRFVPQSNYFTLNDLTKTDFKNYEELQCVE